MECDEVYCQTSEMLWSGSGQLPGGKKKKFKKRTEFKCYVTKMWGGGMGMINGGFTVKMVKRKVLGLSFVRAASMVVGGNPHCEIFL